MTEAGVTGAIFMAQCLKAEGVEKVFGQCGHTNYALIDACQRLGIDYVSFRHEQQAVHAADAYYRVSKKLAVINVHLSPGLTNTVTGVASAAMDGTPMVVITGNTPSYHHPREAHQSMRLHADASQGDIFKPICKRVWRVDDAKFLPEVMHRALNIAQTGRPGAVLLDIPMDVFSQKIEAEPITRSRRPNFPRSMGDAQGVAEAAKLLAAAANPVIFAGNGVAMSGAFDELRVLAERLQAPVATTLVGKGVFPETHPLSVGTTGIWGARVANDTTRNADVILAVGTAFGEADCSSWRSDHTFDIPGSTLIQIDIDPQEIGKSYPVDIGILGDAKATLAQLAETLGASPRAAAVVKAQADTIAARKAAWREELKDTQLVDTKPIHPARLLMELSKAAPADAVFVTDVGWNKNGAGQQLEIASPAGFITSGGMATMGYSPGAAVGAKIGAPDRKVLGLVGDGGLMSVLGALTTAVELDIPVLWVLFNNFCYSTIRTVGTTYFDNKYGTEFRTPDGELYNPDFQMLAKSFGIASALIEEPDDLESGIKAALAKDVPFLLEVRTRGDVPMPRTGYWDIADFLANGND
ncbi:acetolactate synthase-1/2/3 large subunit [Brevundimonas vesicularis]|uniref:thiamine pyrophosphate-binding protein n=1 Tax=Brevundimonas vesicularis TaxID=41276 RepID=UPI00277E67A4|nr:thiamine pyrophosphate-binding protein [Brevundimonas vesicularis]MDQ1191574.1 acetolactate synthase-1/2/3 large subunit [Brevundimonas vesicularis]